jgi:hypothetical protein
MGSTPPAAFHFATAAASRHARAKRTSRTPATAQPRLYLSNAYRVTSNGKQQKTASACKDPCCPCSISSTCSERNCPCAKARRLCRNCDSSHGRCSNTVAAHNAVIHKANRDNLPRSTSARFRARMGLLPRPLIPLNVEPAERTEDDNELATTASPATQRHIRRVQCQDRTQSTSSGASCEGDKVAMSPDGGDTSPPTELSAGNCSVTLQCADCCAPQTQPRFMSERDSDASALIDAPPLPDNRPPPALAPSGVPYLPGASAATDPRSTPSVQPLTQQSTVSGAVGAGQPAADRENVDGGPTHDMVASELEQPATPATTDNADARVTVPPGNAVKGEGDHPPTDGPNAHTPHVCVCVLASS